MSELAADWRRLLSEREHSGLSQAEFCRRRGIKAVSLAWWKRRLCGSPGTSRAGRQRGTRSAGRQRGTRSAGCAGVVEVAWPSRPAHGGWGYEPALPSRAVHGGWAYELAPPGGERVRLPDVSDPERVVRGDLKGRGVRAGPPARRGFRGPPAATGQRLKTPWRPVRRTKPPVGPPSAASRTAPDTVPVPRAPVVAERRRPRPAHTARRRRRPNR